MTDKAKLLGRVRMYDFALVEVIEYLDGHPDNAAALKYLSLIHISSADRCGMFKISYCFGCWPSINGLIFLAV